MRDDVRTVKCKHEGRGIDSLLVVACLFASAPMPACIADEVQTVGNEANIFERFTRGTQARPLTRQAVRGEQSQRQESVVVGERGFEPAPIRAGVVAVAL